MSSHPTDLHMLRNNFGTPEMREIWSDETRLQKHLDIEAALATVQAEMGMIPEEAAKSIADAARADQMDIDALADEVAQVKHSLMPTISALQRASGPAGEYVHYGLTTQDVVDTGTVLQISMALKIIRRDVDRVSALLKGLAHQHRTTLMVGRTHGMQALPTTFGFKLAVWLDEFLRHRERLERIEHVVLTGNLNGAIGTYASMGQSGPEVERRVLDKLGLNTPNISWQSSRDRFSEYASVLALVGASLGKIGNELYNLMRTEIDEIEEPFEMGKIGSSTMPHKRNPAMIEGMASLAAPIKKSMALMFESLNVEHERDAMSWRAEWVAIPELHLYLSAQLRSAIVIFEGLRVNEDAMAKNLDRYGGLLLSERVMFELGKRIGKQTAHHLVYEAAMKTMENSTDFEQELLNYSEIKNVVSTSEIKAWLNPEDYLGNAVTKVDHIIAIAGSQGI